MTILTPSKLETFNYNMPYWVHVYNKNITLLNNVLLKLQGLNEVRQRYLQDGMILVFDGTEWQGRNFRKKLGDGTPCARDDAFDGTNDDPPNSNKWRILTGTPTIQGNRLRLRRVSSTNDSIQSKFSLSGNFEIFVFFDVTGTPSTDSWRVELRFEIDSTHYMSVAAGYSGGVQYRVDYRRGGSAYAAGSTKTKDTGLLRLSRTGGFVSGWFKDGVRDPQWSNVVQGTVGSRQNIGSGSGKVKLQVYTADGNPDVTTYLNNFRVAQGCPGVEITSTTTTTTTTTTT